MLSLIRRTAASGAPLSEWTLSAPCRHIASQATLDTPIIMDAIDSDSRVTAQLSCLIGLAGAQLHERLSEAALRAVGALCDFDAARDARTKCLKAAAAVAAGGDDVAEKMMRANLCADGLRLVGRDGSGCAVEVSTTLLEGASVRGGPPPEEQRGVVYVTGQRGWVLSRSWVISSACVAALPGGQRVMRSTAQLPGDLRRKVVLAAAMTCAPLPTYETYSIDPAALLKDYLLPACPPP